MKSAKEKAFLRIKSRWDEAQKDKKKKEQEYKRHKSLIAETINTKGWLTIVIPLQTKIESLMETLHDTSSFRIFKGMELRSEIRSRKSLLLSMQKNEKIYLSEKLKE